MIELHIRTQKRTQSVPIRREVEAILARQGWRNGLLTLFVPHTTAGITVQEEDDPHVMEDLFRTLEQVAPWDNPAWQHHEGNAASHVKAALIGNSLQLLVQHSQLRLGRWQGVFLCEFDGPRTRNLWLEFVEKDSGGTPFQAPS
ncbi:secondary thiamine-phosphate synthase enzyme YjbQ [Candidatus Methylacidithermus pantelleriae]|uniref:YjbQ family protein n=1 Tax=Candidatus Methylacidithermus pantelleriae TaxID=2744239 RepID=A0A8J2FNU7_9BACT|nr:secondary thiamine-phosphate synthase enzyme YjbQ [Candidatus Methylacidithermus pantelleriae]CAF0695379.1 conserved hypothetical protein [Candidatus Methylacidithermus pantelleriae]